MLFIYVAIAYALGNVFYFSFLFNSNLLLLLLISLCNFLLFFIFKNTKCFIALLLLLSFNIAISYCGIIVNIKNTKILTDSIINQYIYGEIQKVESSNYNHKQSIILKNITFPYEINEKLPHRVKLVITTEEQFIIGDIIKARAFLYPPSSPLIPYGYNFKKNSFMKGIGANGFITKNFEIIDNFEKQDSFFINNWIIHIRNLLKEKVMKNAKIDTAPFILAISLGQYSFLPEKNLDNLRKTSLAHLISISGYHISLITGFLFIFIRYFLMIFPRLSLYFDNKKITASIIICFLILYLLIIGNHTPAIRATIMAIAFLLAIIFNFRAFSLNSLFLAGLIILLFKPFSIFNASFLLSFIATATIISFWQSKVIKKYYIKSQINLIVKIIYVISTFILMTFLVQLSLIPILSFYFGEIPLLGIVANTIASPIFAILIMPSLIVFYMLPDFLGKYFLYIAEQGLLFIFQLANFLANLKITSLNVNFLFGYILAIFILGYVLYLITNNKLRYLFLSLAILPFLFHFLFFKNPDILIDNKFQLVAFKDSNNNYSFSNKYNNFIKSIWFKNLDVDFKYTIYDNNNFSCINSHCIIKIKDKLISYSNNANNFQEDCNNIDLIIIKVSKPFICKGSIVIDNNHLQEKGSTMVFIIKNKIKIISNN